MYTLTDEQIDKLADALACAEDAGVPAITDDPFVNYLVDRIFVNEKIPYNEVLYIAEVEAFKALDNNNA